MVAKDVLVADLGGAVSARVAVVKEDGKFFVKAPKEFGGKLEAVPADTLTDCINFKAWEWNKELKAKEKAAKKGDREKKA